MQEAQGKTITSRLLSGDGIPFTARTMYAMPDESGIYMFVHNGTKEVLYVGMSRVGLRSRMKDHWDGTESSDLAQKLVNVGVVSDLRRGKDWIRDNVVIRYLTSDEFDVDVASAEAYVIDALNPRLNG